MGDHTQEIKIAAVTDDHLQLSNHFGRAPYYRVVTIRSGQVVAEEERSKAFHGERHEAVQHHSHESLHHDMFAPIADCQVLLAGGMGEPAYLKAQSVGLEVVLIGGEISRAVQAYLNGTAVSDPRRIHHH